MRGPTKVFGASVVLGSAAILGQMYAVATPLGDGGVAGGGGTTEGPDVIVGSLSDIARYGSVSGVAAYAVGTTSCNIGDEVLQWRDTGPRRTEHPVIAQNFYRLKDGRIEQIGMSWLKHGFCALSGTLCGPCGPNAGCDELGVGCSDPYGAGLNGSQSGLGPRSQVNPATGIFPYPVEGVDPAAPTIGRRLQVQLDDLDPSMNPGALYFAEGHYVTPDDAAAGNDDNNASYRRMSIGSFSSGAYNVSLTGPTFQQKPAIQAWRDHGLGVNEPDERVQIVAVDVPDDGRFHVGFKAADNGDGTWRYEYAVHNLSSDLAAGSFTVPVPVGVTVTDLHFHDVPHHSGEPYSDQDWSESITSDAVAWTDESVIDNSNGNAIRWGTMYSFGFTADAPPASADATIGLFGNGSSIDVMVDAPSAPVNPCDINQDGVVDGADLGLLLGSWASKGGPSDINGDGIVDGADLGLLLGCWDA